MTSGKRGTLSVVITRSREGNEELADKLKIEGLNPITVETIVLAPPEDWEEVDRLLGRLDSFDWVVFTSSTGVRFFGARMNKLSLSLPWKTGPRVAAVGPQTARALSKIGVRTDFIPSSFTTKLLGEQLPAEEGEKVLLLRSDIADPVLERKLTERGLEVERTAIYRTLPGKGLPPRIKDADLIVFASPSAVKGFCESVAKGDLRRLKSLKTVCIGPVTESAARESGFTNTTKPESYTIDALVREIKRLSHSSA